MASQPPADVSNDTPAPAASEPAVTPGNALALAYPDDPPRQDDAPPASEADNDGNGDGDKPPTDDNQSAEEQPEPDLPPIAVPTSWAKDAKDMFAGLPREAQEVIAARETDRDREVRRVQTEAATARQTAERQYQDQAMQVARRYAEQLESYAQQFEVQPPDIRLLQSGDPAHQALYNEQDRAYRIGTANREHLAAQSQQARSQAEQFEQQRAQQELLAESATLEKELGTEWSDPSARATLLGSLQPIAAELGYSPEVMAQAGAADILALRTASQWKAKAAKYDQLNKAKMVPVREAKALPPAAKPAAPQAAQPKGMLATLYPDDVRR